MNLEYQQGQDAIRSMDEDATATVTALAERIADAEDTSPPLTTVIMPLGDPSGMSQTAAMRLVVATVLVLLAVVP